MPDSRSRPFLARCSPRLERLFGLLALMLLYTCPPPLHAAEPIQVVVSGIEGEALKNVREALTLPAGLLREGSVDRLWLDRFARQVPDRSKSALEPFGYYRARVAVTVEEEEGVYRLLVRVEAGEPVRLDEVRVELAGPGREEKRLVRLVETFPLKTGDVLLHQEYEQAKGALLSEANDLGYLRADFPKHEIRIDKTATRATLHLVLDTGERHYFGETTIQGAPAYPDTFLRRHLTYRPGQIFSHRLLGETQRNFTNSERFKEVLITPQKQEAGELRVPVRVRLQPGPRISLRPGVGYGTDTGFRSTLGYRDLNVFRLGHELYGQLYLAERLQGVVVGYVRPSPENVRSSTRLQMNLQREETDTYDSRILALELSRNLALGRGKLFTAYLKTQYEDYSVGDEKSTSRLVLPGLRFSHNRYDNPIRPHRGYRYLLDLRGTHRLLGSDTALFQILAEGGHLLPLPGRFSLHTRAHGALTLLNDPLRDIPPSLRFFAGGDQSVRGYSYKSLGPRDGEGDVVGGKHLLTASVELERALFDRWGVSLFYDVGNAFDSFTDLRLYQGAGVGLHYYLSIGALNLSLARQIGVESPSFHVHFTVGFEL